MSFKLKTFSLLLISMLLLAACASTPKIDPRMTALESKLAALTNNSELASRGGAELKTAEAAVRRAGNPSKQLSDQEESYNFYAADRLITTAEMSARSRLAEDKRKELVREQEKLVLEARTLEANMARAQAEQARTQAEQAQRSAADAMALRERALLEAANAEKMRDAANMESDAAKEKQRMAESATAMALSDAESARLLAEAESERASMSAQQAAMSAQQAAEEARKAAAAKAEADAAKAEADAARAEANAARAEMDSLRNRLSELEAKQTERGLLITLGDVLFEFNKSELKPGAARNLQPLADALNERTDQSVIIEGHTDSIGSHEYNMALSKKRAQAVEAYLLEKGIAVGRMTVTGLGPDFPLADNNSEAGRQKNRRVEVILPNLK